MLKKKNAAELSINIIILVILGLIVLVVIMALFSRESGKTVKTLESCASRGGTCESSCNGGTSIPNICKPYDDPWVGPIDQVCCVKIS